MKPLRRVAQADETGCGPACIAMLLRTDYSRAKRQVFSREPERKNVRTDITTLRRALSKSGKWLGRKSPLHSSTTKAFCSTAAELREQIGRQRAIVMMNEYWSKKDHCWHWHWAVWDGFRLLDPWHYKRHRYIAYYPLARC